MSQSAIDFIEKLESGKPPIDNGFIIYEGGFFSAPFWYRYNNNRNIWEWSNDLMFWMSVMDKVNREIFHLSSDNIYIINYLRLKSKARNIMETETQLANFYSLVQTLYNQSSISEQLEISDEYFGSEHIQDYYHQLSHEKNVYDSLTGQLCATELEYENDKTNTKTRNSLKILEQNYAKKINSIRLEIIESRMNYNRLLNDLYRDIIKIQDQNNKTNSNHDAIENINTTINKTIKTNELDDIDLLLNYRLEDDVSQASRYFYNQETHIENPELSKAFSWYQENLFKILGIDLGNNTNLPKGSLELTIQNMRYQSDLQRQELQTKNNEIVQLQKMNNLLKTDHNSVKNDLEKQIKTNTQLELAKNRDKMELDKLNKEFGQVKNRISTLETQVADLEGIRTTLVDEKSQLQNLLSQSQDIVDKLYSENEELFSDKKYYKNLFERVLTMCPNLSYNEQDGTLVYREDTYDIIMENDLDI